MERTTIMLPPDLKAKVQKQANFMGMSLGQYIREAVENALEYQHRKQPVEADPLFSDDAVFSGKGPKDIAENHDQYLYEDNK